MRILFTGGRAPATLELVKNFGQKGWEIHVADCIDTVISQFSRYTKSFCRICSPRYDEAIFVSDLIRIINSNKIDVLFPTCEEIFWIAKNKNTILENCSVHIVCDNIEKLALLHNKYRFIEFAKSEGVLTPETYIFNGKNTFDKKAVIKPIFSRFGEETMIVDVKSGLPRIDYSEKQYVLQEFINGESVCSYGFADNGILKFNICYKSPFKTQKTFTAFKPFECPTINEVANRIAKKLNFTGNISFDFIAAGGQYYLIECNPRITSGIHIICDNDFAKMLFDKPDVLLTREAQLLIPTLMTKYRLILFKDVVFNAHDIKPFIKQLSCLMRFNSIAQKNKISLTKATVFDIEWNGEGVEEITGI